MHLRPIVGFESQPREVLFSLMRLNQIRQLPLVDPTGHIVGLEVLEDLLQPVDRPNPVVLMAGGLGTRLSPLTDACPKSMLEVGGRPILETILLNFLEHGFRHFYISVNHKADVISSYFGDGSRWNVIIEYVRESNRLGTAGALGLLPRRPDSPLVVMNGDVLTKVDMNALLEFHAQHSADATMCVREFEFQVPYGVVRVNAQEILSIEEKPIQRYFVNAGIYVFQPRVLDLIEPETPLNMNELFERIIATRWRTAVFPLREYWVDIGQHTDFTRANGEFSMVFK